MSEVKMGMATCSRKEFLAGSNLSFLVVAKVVLVLDRKSVDTGQIIGVMCEDDVVCPSLLDQDWVMLSEGSWVRHPKLRKGRIRLRRDGWLVSRHPDYGELLTILPSGRVRALFESGGFAAVPVIKLSKPAAAEGGGSERGAAEEAVAEAGAPGATDAEGLEALPPLPTESLELHLKACKTQHWEVFHDEAHLRSNFTRGSRLLLTLRHGSVVCLGPNDTSAPASPDGRWARCVQGARVWSARDSRQPRLLLGGQEAPGEAYLLKESEDHEIIKRIDPQPKPKGKAKARQRKDPELDANYELTRRLTTEDYWNVLSDDVDVHAERSEGSAAEVRMRSGDILFTAGEEEPAIWEDADQEWLMAPAGSHVYRGGQWIHGLQARGFVLIEASGRARIERGREPEATGVMRMVSGFGEPWMVVHDQLQVYPRLSKDAPPMGVLLRGDVVGVRRCVGEWSELARDTDLRTDAFAASGASGVASASPARRVSELQPSTSRLLDEGSRLAASARSGQVRRVVQGDPDGQVWVLAEDPVAGQLLRRCAAPLDGSVLAARLLSDERRQLYREVLALCHQRIYVENLQGLWEGDSSKLPTLETLEAKLFDESSRVVHVTKDDRFCGGAVLKELSVKARYAHGEGPAHGGGPATASVCYIDMCAAKPGSRAGADIFDLLVSMKYACITCHPILLQSTVSFWQSRGMRRFDVDNEKDSDEFRRQVIEHTGGTICELADVQACLPPSKLPLFVFVSTRFVKPRTRIGDLL